MNYLAGTVGQSPEFNMNNLPGTVSQSPEFKMNYLAGTVGQSPEFIGSIANVTISQGRDAAFACSVKNLGGFKVMIIFFDNA